VTAAQAEVASAVLAEEVAAFSLRKYQRNFQTVMMNDALTVFSSRGPFREQNLSIPG